MTIALSGEEASPARPRRVSRSMNPATGEVWREFPSASAADVHAMVARARAAQPAWAALPLRERVRILHRFRARLHERRHEVADAVTRENGKPTPEALGHEVVLVMDHARFHARHARRVLAPEGWAIPAGLAFWRKRVRVRHVPYGVIAVIAPWNYPFLLGAGHLLPALVAGNAVLLKPSELTPTTGALLVELLREAGVPPDVVHVVHGDGAAGAALTAADVDKVFFTGSVATGRRVALACAERLVPCVLELGGSDAAIVLPDADVANAAAGIVWARFSNAGQTCVAPKRVIAVGEAYAPLAAELARQVATLRVGPGSDPRSEVGPLIRAEQGGLLRAQLDDALAQGAQVLAQAPAPDDPTWFPPTLLGGATPAMRVLREETFGPLLPLLHARDADEAVRMANTSAMGLSGSVWGRDARRATAVADRLETGSVTVNDANVAAGMPSVSHGGVKQSGTGRAHGIEGLRECVRTQTVIVDRFHAWRQPWWFGYGPDHPAHVDAFARLTHGRTLGERLSGVAGTLRMMLERGHRPSREAGTGERTRGQA